MNQRYTQRMEAELKDWGMWRRQGKTVPNRLGHGSKHGVQPAEASDERNATQVMRHWQCKDCETVIQNKSRPKQCDYCRAEGRYIRIEPSKITGTQSRNRTAGSVAVDHFNDDKREREIECHVKRLELLMQLLVKDCYIKGRSLREIASLWEVSPSTVNRLHGECLAFLLGIENQMKVDEQINEGI